MLQAAAEQETAALAARLEELEEVSAGALAAAEVDVKKAQDEAAGKVEKNNERANEVRAVCLSCLGRNPHICWITAAAPPVLDTEDVSASCHDSHMRL